MKKKVKQKEVVRLRQKSIANGNASIYLDINHKGKRKYEFLRMYIVPELTPADKERNAETLRLANAIKADRIVAIERGTYGMEQDKEQDTDFFPYAEALIAKKNARSHVHYRMRVVRHMRDYAKTDALTFSDIDKRWVNGFISYLDALDVSETTKKIYYAVLKSVLNQAVRDGIINRSPAMGLTPFHPLEYQRQYLTIEELKRLTTARCKNDMIRRMFLFSCLTGLRWSDIVKLQWSDVSQVGDFTRITFRQKKTKQQEYMDITKEAVTLMGERGKGIIFRKHDVSYAERILADWVAAAKIDKHITFHCARHTFAVMMLDIGTDIYTVSKLLGHRELSTTQIYAKILDKNKQKAVAKIPKIGV